MVLRLEELEELKNEIEQMDSEMEGLRLQLRCQEPSQEQEIEQLYEKLQFLSQEKLAKQLKLADLEWHIRRMEIEKVFGCPIYH